MNKKYGVLLINLGTPKDHSRKQVRKYLKEFLNDKRVVDLPWLIRKILVNFIIIPFRSKNSAEAYQKIWTNEGSPLLVNSFKLLHALSKRFNNELNIELGMRYGTPSIKDALEKLDNVDNLIVLPLYPQYSSAATGSSIEAVYQALSKKQTQPNLTLLRDFYLYPDFLNAQANLIKKARINALSHLLFSYHGLPEAHLIKGGCKSICAPTCSFENNNPSSCYRKQCYKTTQEISQRLNIPSNQYSTSFQSRLGKTPWIKPYTDHTLTKLINEGILHLTIVCPSFTADCLETLEEIEIQAKQQWLSLGGESFQMIPCLNDEPEWIDALENLVRDHLCK